MWIPGASSVNTLNAALHFRAWFPGNQPNDSNLTNVTPLAYNRTRTWMQIPCSCQHTNMPLSRWTSEWWPLYPHPLPLGTSYTSFSHNGLLCLPEHTRLNPIRALHYHFPLSGNFFLQIITWLALSYLWELHYRVITSKIPPLTISVRLPSCSSLSSLAHHSAVWSYMCAC